jgi:hypothetical protein
LEHAHGTLWGKLTLNFFLNGFATAEQLQKKTDFAKIRHGGSGEHQAAPQQIGRQAAAKGPCGLRIPEHFGDVCCIFHGTYRFF